ncbi:DinB family protein [Solitalea canadensis]|uniref:Damage-inducible protein DinB n=1 Tax=Solitalea canadensis (strain ATCC 29591 / DSM 3403 / JCM 21819 / LMG 8368 / NBRC 15130 / NCIMB 12057 / USAM 9D) TaxID=929556 RepID=H8KMZ2_SOLCM|nr:DinB family protein [Solitalea canadensis]AFD09071.1 hypothetical protein Solca_4081 [Solitalea canadensis DSM 3403]
MKAFFKELFEYNFNFNQKTLTILTENQGLVSDKLIKLHSHVANSHGIWNSKIRPSNRSYKPWDIYSVPELIELNLDNFNTSMAIIDEFDLDLPINYSLSTGKMFTHSIRDILFQIINHSTYHRGQIATEFRQCNMEPILTDWIVYKMS